PKPCALPLSSPRRRHPHPYPSRASQRRRHPHTHTEPPRSAAAAAAAMTAGSVRQMGAAVRRGIGAARRGLATYGDASARRGLATYGDSSARRLAKADEMVGDGWTTNDTWLLSQITEFGSSSSKEIHKLRLEAIKLEMQLNDMKAKTRDRKAERTVEMTEWAVLGVGTFSICAMHLYLLCT
ncbi:unnamed protein product, partial [Urochloa humidicola]